MSSEPEDDTLGAEQLNKDNQSLEESKEEIENKEETKEGEKEDGEEEEEEEEEKEKSLIVEGKREKKKVERLSLEVKVQKQDPLTMQGKGEKLCEIESIQYYLKKKKLEDLRVLHKLLYNRPGTVNAIRKNIGQFSGFPFEAGSEQYKKKEDVLKKLNKVTLKNICEILNLQKKGTNIDITIKILDFLMEPKHSGKTLPKLKTLGKSGKTSPGTTKKSAKNKQNAVQYDDLSTENKNQRGQTSKKKEQKEPPKKTAKKETPKQKATPKSKTTVKSANIKKADSSTPKKNQNNAKRGAKVLDSESESDSSDDEPLIKKLNKPPTDEELKETVKKLLASANLEEVTMKQICRKVNETYPRYDLSDRKDFIKEAVKELIS
nr:protein DEK isoform X2 [Geotrypetes seraphini]